MTVPPKTTERTRPAVAALDIDAAVADPRWAAAVPDVEASVRMACDAVWSLFGAGEPPSEVSVLLTDDAQVRGLNRDYRGIDKPTNVLSFGGHDGDAAPVGEPVMLGDVVLAYETVVGEAESQGIAVGDHFSHLLVHGMLHLLGYDHENDADAREMEGLETSILASLGVDDPYAERDGG